MVAQLFDKNQVDDAFDQTDWQCVVYKEFVSSLLNEVRPFPCIFGINGMQLNHLRFAFSEDMSPHEVAPILDYFVKNCRDFGSNTSLVVFSHPKTLDTINNYRKRFWELLLSLSKIDQSDWPEQIPKKIDTPMWEFSFAGEPIFVVCNTPAHVQRQSRRSSAFMVTFQPRWVFDHIFKNPKAAEKSFNKIRSRLCAYDLVPPSPHLGKYGMPEVREFKQYFLLEDNNAASCPFQSLEPSITRKGEN